MENVKQYRVYLARFTAPNSQLLLRSTQACRVIVFGADLRAVQEMLGHENIQTTQIYTHVTNRQLRSVHEAFHGKGR